MADAITNVLVSIAVVFLWQATTSLLAPNANPIFNWALCLLSTFSITARLYRKRIEGIPNAILVRPLTLLELRERVGEKVFITGEHRTPGWQVWTQDADTTNYGQTWFAYPLEVED